MVSKSFAESVKLVNGVEVSEEKTKQLIENLKESGQIVGIEDLSTYIRKKGVIVKEHIGRKRNYLEISPKIFGVDLSQKDEETRNFFKEHLKMGKIKFIPDSDEKKLINLESSLRMARRRASIGYDDSFMSIETYQEFLKDFEKKKKEYFEIRDDIVNRWDVLIKRFKEGLWQSLTDLNAVDKETVFDTIVSKLPTQEEYEKSFYMELTVKAFPVMENLDMFDNNIREQIMEGLNHDTIQTLYEIIANTLNDAFENVSKVVTTLSKNEKIANKTLGSIKKTAERISQKNIFHNDVIDQIKNDILEMIRESHDSDVMSEIAEKILFKIYGYAKELGVHEQISLTNSPFSEDELLEAYEFLKLA